MVYSCIAFPIMAVKKVYNIYHERSCFSLFSDELFILICYVNYELNIDFFTLIF